MRTRSRPKKFLRMSRRAFRKALRFIRASSNYPRLTSSGGLFAIETFADRACQFLWRVGFLQKVYALLNNEILAHNVRAVAAGKDCLQSRLLRLHLLRQIAPRHPVGH